MTPLLESLLAHLARTDLDAAARARAESVVFDVLQPSERQFALAAARRPADRRRSPRPCWTIPPTAARWRSGRA